MADKPVVHIGENSPEQVAYKLLHDIANVERKNLHQGSQSDGWSVADRSWILSTYKECLRIMRDPFYS